MHKHELFFGKQQFQQQKNLLQTNSLNVLGHDLPQERMHHLTASPLHYFTTTQRHP